jgi:DNA-binding NarL/FixJ family response regulator
MVVIVVERRDFLRGCLNHWLDQFSSDFRPVAIPDITTAPADDMLERAAVVLIGAGHAECADHWLECQVESLAERHPKLPIALLVDARDTDASRAVGATARQAGVQGCITTSMSMSVAMAALRLIAAGGLYFPTLPHATQSSDTFAFDQPRSATTAEERFEKLTPRELAVLSVLAIGAQNKIIAYRLGMSMSTVKAHMHSIIRKLHVRNRTEAVVAARAMNLTQRTELSGVVKKAA